MRALPLTTALSPLKLTPSPLAVSSGLYETILPMARRRTLKPRTRLSTRERGDPWPRELQTRPAHRLSTLAVRRSSSRSSRRCVRCLSPTCPTRPGAGPRNIGSPAFPTRGPDIRLQPTQPTQPFPQIKVRDLSHTSVSIAPADYSSWHDVRTQLMAEAKTGFKARVEAELAAGELQPLDAALNLTTNPIPYPTSQRREPRRAQGRVPAGGARD